MKRFAITIVTVLALVASARAQSVPQFSVDICTGGDLHDDFRTVDDTGHPLSNLWFNLVMVSKDATYTDSDSPTGCPKDVGAAVLGKATIKQEDLPYFNRLMSAATPPARQYFTEVIFTLTAGQIICRGFMTKFIAGNSFTLGSVLPIVGGTGAYAGIKGQMNVQPIAFQLARITFVTK